MKIEKAFDCVAYKLMVQAKHAEENAGLTPEERVKKLEDWAAHSDDPMARWWRSARASKVAEDAADY
jgi:hypothetical protein